MLYSDAFIAEIETIYSDQSCGILCVQWCRDGVC